MRAYTEDHLIEQPSIALLSTLGWQTVNAYHTNYEPNGLLGRENAGEVVVFARLLSALDDSTPAFLQTCCAWWVAGELARDRSSLSRVEANREVYHRPQKPGLRHSQPHHCQANQRRGGSGPITG